jgi:hypothetical protein
MTTRARAGAALLLAVLSAAALALTACGTPRVPVGEADYSAVQRPSMMPTPNEFVSAVMHTRDLGSANVEITVDTTIDGSRQHLDGVGAVALGRGFGNILWTDDEGTMRVINNDVATFVRDDEPSGLWNQLPDGVSTPRTAFADPIASLGLLADVLADGVEEIDGIPTTRYTGRLAADPKSLAAFGLADDQIATLTGTAGGLSVTVTAWVDSTGQIVRVDRVFSSTPEGGTPVDLRVSTTLSDFSGVIDVGPPPSASVTSASASTPAAS